MPIDSNVLLNEARCLGCGSLSESEMITVALLQRIAEASGGGGGTPGGGLNSVQFNDGGAFGGDADLTWNKTTNLLSITGGIALAGEANETQLAITGHSLTGAASNRMLNLAGTWNTTGNPVALQIAITDTASGATSKFLEFAGGAGGGTSAFGVDKLGNVDITTIGSLTASSPALEMTQTWNNAGVTFTGLSMSITDTASSATSKFLEFLGGAGGATSMFNVSKAGNATAVRFLAGSGTVGAPGMAWSTDDDGTGHGFYRVSATETALAFNGIQGIRLGATYVIGIAAAFVFRIDGASGSFQVNADVALQRQGVGVFEINSTTLGAFRDLELRTIITNNAVALVRSDVAMTDFAAASLGTLSNAPSAGNPAKWIAIVDNGTTRYIPTWI